MNKRILAVFTAACTICATLTSMVPATAKAGEVATETTPESSEEAAAESSTESAATTIHIGSVEDLKEFAGNCKIDSYSENMTVELDCDLDLSNEPFTPIPVFMGTFNGNNHTISGFVCANDGSNQGFFRYIQEEGVVNKLNIEGTVSPSTGQCNIGGIAGTNYGTIQFCTFKGDVEGLVHVGGIAGYNQGTILTCATQGKVLGKQYTGGICGYNEGNVAGCSNEADVNTEIRTGEVDITKLSLLDVADIETISSTDSEVVIDMGGIVGGSTGVVKSCTNMGTVGYQHYGYNVGGIAGRQSGFLTGCENYGDVLGRKDVAGICGQMEPYLYLAETESLVDDLQGLNDAISAAMGQLSGDASAMSGALASMKSGTSSALSDAKTFQDIIDKLYADKESSGDESDDSDDSNAGQTIKDIGTDIKNSIDGIDSETKEDILNGDVSKDTVDKVIESVEQNTGDNSSSNTGSDSTGDSTGESTGDGSGDGSGSSAADIENAAGDVVDHVVSDAENIDDSTIQDIANGNVTSDDIQNITDTAENSAAAEAAQKAAAAIAASQAEDDAQQEARDQALATIESQLASKIASIGSALASMNDNLAGMTANLAASLAAVNGQFERVNQLLTKIMTGDMIYYQDISALDTEEDVNGKVSHSVNHGNVEGDENVGGIAGEMAIEVDFDVAEDLLSGDLSAVSIVSKIYETRDVIRSCENDAPITSRKSNTGGVVGNNSLGIVLLCENYGDVTGEADNVGGIAGNSDSAIMKSYSMCDLSGISYIGGIVGKATQITDCLAMVTIADEHAACSGAIAGYLDVTEENAAVNNYFISDTLGAIDGISYKGMGEPIDYSDLEAVTTLPDNFKNMLVTFVADDVTVKIIKVEYGKDLDAMDIPEVPEKEGYTGVWEAFDSTAIKGCFTVEAVYTSLQTSMESTESVESSELPGLLVEGTFVGTSSITESEYTGDLSFFSDQKVQDAVTIDIHLTDDSEKQSSYALRYRPAGDNTNVKLYMEQTDGTFAEIPFTVEGSYLAFEIPSETANIVCVDNRKDMTPYYIGGGAVAALLVIFLICRRIRSGKKGKKNKTEE